MKSNKQEFYKMEREDGEVFEVKHNLVEGKKSQGYELVDEEPIIRDLNTSTHGNQDTQQEEETQDEEDQEDKSLDELSYNELQSFVSERADDYNVVGKSEEELAQKAQELVD